MTEASLVLTEEEWEDLAHMVEHYRNCTDWVERAGLIGKVEEAVFRRRGLAARIMEAVR